LFAKFGCTLGAYDEDDSRSVGNGALVVAEEQKNSGDAETQWEGGLQIANCKLQIAN
jgi:hypothetical protein